MTLPIPPELPLLPTPRERALLVLMNPDAALEDYLSVVEGDPALTTAVLRAANSAMSWPARLIADASEGVVRLGTSAVRHLITTTVVRSQFATIEASDIDADELWRHVLACALLSEAQTDDEAAGREAFTVGLLHDLGRLAMAAQAPTRYREVVHAAQEGTPASQVERALFGVTHAEFGQRICERWRLPDRISETVGEHHDVDFPNEGPSALDATPTSDTSRRLATARWIVRGMGIGDGVHRPEQRNPLVEDHAALQQLGGRAELMIRIRWFRDSTQGRHRTAA